MPDSPKPSGTTVTHEMARAIVAALPAQWRETHSLAAVLAYISEQEAVDREHATKARVSASQVVTLMARIERDVEILDAAEKRAGTAEREVERLRAELECERHLVELACVTPEPTCTCPGCSLARQENR